MTRLLLIDADAERAQQAERRLRLWGLECSIADCFLYALTMLEWQPPEIILIRAENLDSMTPEEFCATLKQDPVLRDIPLALVGGPGTKSVAANRRFDLVLEDLDHRTLGADLARFLKGRERATEVSNNYDTVEILPLLDQIPQKVNRREFGQRIEQLALDLQSGRLTIQSEARSGPIFVILDHGQIVHAAYGGLEGPPAFRRLLDAFGEATELGCLFEPEPRWKVGTYPRSIQQADRQHLLDQASQPDVSAPQVLKFKLPRQ